METIRSLVVALLSKNNKGSEVQRAKAQLASAVTNIKVVAQKSNEASDAYFQVADDFVKKANVSRATAAELENLANSIPV